MPAVKKPAAKPQAKEAPRKVYVVEVPIGGSGYGRLRVDGQPAISHLMILNGRVGQVSLERTATPGTSYILVEHAQPNTIVPVSYQPR